MRTRVLLLLVVTAATACRSARREMTSTDMNKSPKDPRVVSLYGVALRIPPGWVDASEYHFVGSGPILQLIWKREPLASTDVDGRLELYRDNFAGYLGRGHVGDLRDYAHPRWRARGFRGNFLESPAGPSFHEVGLEREADAIFVGIYTASADVDVAEALVASIAPYGSVPLGVRHRYRVFDVGFIAPTPLETPEGFWFYGNDEEQRLGAGWSRSEPVLEAPEWSQRFAFPLDSTVEVKAQPSRTVQTAGSAAPPGMTPFPLTVVEQKWQAVAREPSGRTKDLLYGAARARVGERHLELEFYWMGDVETGLSVWASIVDSMTLEGR